MKKVASFTTLILIDQILKYLAKNDLLSFPGGDLFIEYVCNPNISWGIQINEAFFFTLWSIFIVGLFFYARKQNWDSYLMLVLVGAASNMLDRLVYGCVVDYISLWSFPVFNFADILIVCGMMLFLFKQNCGSRIMHHSQKD